MTYLDGLKAAEALCSERSKQAREEAKRWDAEADKVSCLTCALEALECSVAIKHLIREVESNQQRKASA
jgi:hypothetical protein